MCNTTVARQLAATGGPCVVQYCGRRPAVDRCDLWPSATRASSSAYKCCSCGFSPQFFVVVFSSFSRALSSSKAGCPIAPFGHIFCVSAISNRLQLSIHLFLNVQDICAAPAFVRGAQKVLAVGRRSQRHDGEGHVQVPILLVEANLQ